MGTEFNADEVLAMAERIERNGQGFYLLASRSVADKGVSGLLADLGVWEKGHEALFTGLRKRLTPEQRTSTAIDPYNETFLYLDAMADDHVFARDDLDPSTVLTPGMSPVEVLNLALKFEKESILFFLGLKRMVPERLGSDEVEKVISEEIGHMAYIEKKKRELLRT
jgi:rubrerythrin